MNEPNLSTEHDVYVVGDVHGRFDLLARLLDQIDASISSNSLTDPRLVFLGDYVDRGEDSKNALAQLYALSCDFPDLVTCLLGNHEEMMLAFLRAPISNGPRWLRHGGLQTLASYGIWYDSLGGAPREDELSAAAHALSNALGPLKSWLEELPTSWKSGNLWAVHAGIDPASPMEAQSSRSLLWGHPDFISIEWTEPFWIVHGHSIVPEPKVSGRVISVDTGAYYSGRLTAAHICSTGDISFISTS